MTFASEIEKPDSERFMLVEIVAKKRATGGVSLGGNLYEFQIASGLFIDSVLADGVSKSFTYSGTTLTVTSGSSLVPSTVYVIVYHKLFLTATKHRLTSGVSGLPDASWEPRLQSYPSAKQSMRNIADGVFSLSSSSISVITTDNYIQNMSGVNDSFSDSSVRIWMCINTLENNKIIFQGRITDFSISGNVATFSVIDEFLKLKDSGRFGTKDQSIINLGSSLCEYPDSKDYGTAAPMVLGYSSPFKLKLGNSATHNVDTTTRTLHVTEGLNLIKDTPQVVNNGTTNASYFVGKFIGTALKKMTFGTVTRVYRKFSLVSYWTDGGNTVNGVQYVYHIKCTNFSGQIGDCLPDGLPGVASGRPLYVIQIGSHTGPDAQTYDFICQTQIGYWSTGSPDPDGVLSNPVIPDNTYDSYCVFRSSLGKANINYEYGGGFDTISSDMFYYLHQHNGTVTPSIVSLGTIGGVTVSALYININFSTLVAGSNNTLGLDNVTKFDDLQCRFSPSSGLNHGDAIKFIIRSSGLEVDTTSTTQADSDLVAEVCCTFPLSGSRDFESYLEQAQYICKSTLSILTINDDREVVYKVLEDISAVTADGSRDDVDIIRDSATSNCDYFDITSNIVFENPQVLDIDSFDGSGSRAELTDGKAKYLHNKEKSIKYEHGLRSIQNRKQIIMDYYANANVEYKIKTASKDLSSSIGDVIDLTNDSILNDSSNIKAIIVDVENSTASTDLTLQELRGLS